MGQRIAWVAAGRAKYVYRTQQPSKDNDDSDRNEFSMAPNEARRHVKNEETMLK